MNGIIYEICPKCGDSFEQNKGKYKKKFCSRRCANSRDFNDISKHKKRIAQLKNWEKGIYDTSFKRGEESPFWKPNEIRKCKWCGNQFEVNWPSNPKKTCSKSCATALALNRTYRNGSRKTIKYKNVILESGWELKIAKWLDKHNVNWIRPNPIEWVDNSGNTHLYYPDFLLTDYDLYLDPKNPYCMALDREKMKIVENKVNILYGNVDMIIEHLTNL